MNDSILDVDFSTDFTRMVDADIQKCEVILAGNYDEKVWKDLHIELTSKYSAHISDISSNMCCYFANGSFYDINSMNEATLRHNLLVLKNKLIAFKNYGYKNRESVAGNKGINIQNNQYATQTQTVNISFEAVKKQIEDMTALSDAETKETLHKIDEIKAIVELKEPKKSKWQKIKPILIWLADKSVDVGIALLPLIAKIGESL